MPPPVIVTRAPMAARFDFVPIRRNKTRCLGLGMSCTRSESRSAGYIFKRAIAFVPEQKHRLPISRAVIDDGIHLRINVAAGHKHIGPAIVVKVHEACAPLDIGVYRLTHLRTPTQFDESLSRSLVAI